MARIAEDLFLLLLDNAAGQPALDRPRRQRVLTAAVLLDLAYACQIRPAVAGEPVEAGRLVALSPRGPVDPVCAPALRLLSQRPLPPSAALSKLARHTESNLSDHLLRTGQIGRIQLPSKRLRRSYSWPLTNRERVGTARSELLSALFDGQPPGPQTAAIISLLHAVDGLGALLSLNERGWRWVHARCTDITTGGWMGESAGALPEMNLAVTMSVVRPALTRN